MLFLAQFHRRSLDRVRAAHFVQTNGQHSAIPQVDVSPLFSRVLGKTLRVDNSLVNVVHSFITTTLVPESFGVVKSTSLRYPSQQWKKAGGSIQRYNATTMQQTWVIPDAVLSLPTQHQQ